MSAPLVPCTTIVPVTGVLEGVLGVGVVGVALLLPPPPHPPHVMLTSTIEITANACATYLRLREPRGT